MRKREEDVIKRKAYYGFARNYPGQLGSAGYVIGESLAVRKREILRKVLIAVLLLLLFVAAFVVTTVGLQISDRPAPAAETAVETTAAPVAETAETTVG